MTQREENKRHNRQRILTAARQIIAAEGVEKLTMRHLAEVAEVSSRTPYNLFGSKTDILVKLVSELIVPPSVSAVATEHTLCVETLIESLIPIYNFSTQQHDFYKAIFWDIMQSADEEAKAVGRSRLVALIEPLLDRAIANDELVPGPGTTFLTNHLSTLMLAIFGMWAGSQITLEEAVANVRYSWINTLLPLAQGSALQWLVETQGSTSEGASARSSK